MLGSIIIFQKFFLVISVVAEIGLGIELGSQETGTNNT